VVPPGSPNKGGLIREVFMVAPEEAPENWVALGFRERAEVEVEPGVKAA
jgi:hypothetical protein